MEKIILQLFAFKNLLILQLFPFKDLLISQLFPLKNFKFIILTIFPFSKPHNFTTFSYFFFIESII